MIITTKKRINLQVEKAVDKALGKRLFEQQGALGGARRGIPSILGGDVTFNESDISIQTYKNMENDAGIVAPLTIVKAPIRSVEWDIECEDKDIREFVKKAIKLVWEQLISDMLLALQFGYQSFEKVFERNNDGIVYKKLLPFDPDYITVKVNDKGGFAGIEILQSNEVTGVIQLPPQKCFHFVHDMRWGNFYGKSKLRPVYKYWFVDGYYYEFQNVFMEKLSGGVVIGYAPSGTTTVNGVEYDNIAVMKGVANDIRSGGVASLPSEIWGDNDRAKKWILELLESKKDTGQFIKAHEHLDTMKARGIFVPDLVYKAEQVGSFALGKEHTNNFILSIKAILDNCKLFINDYLTPQLVEYNFGVNAPPAEWVYSTLSPATVEFLKDLVIELTKKDRAEIPDWEFIFSALGVPVPPQLKNGGGNQDAGKEEDPAENKRHTCGDIHFKREPANKWERQVNFQKLEGDWDSIDDRIIDYMAGYLDSTKDSILAQYTKQMEAGKIDPNSIKISGVKEYKAQLKKYMNEALNIGIESVKSELKTDQKFIVSNDTKNWIDTTINNMVNKQLEDLRFHLGSGIEETIQANLQQGGYDKSTINEAIALAEENYDSRIKLAITISARTITSRGINQGRSIVAENIK